MLRSALYASATIWIVFLIAWFARRRSVDPEEASASCGENDILYAETHAFRLIHVFVSLTSIVLALFVRPWPLDRRWLPDSSIIAILGLLVQSGSLLFAARARRYLGKGWSGGIVIKRGHELIRGGPYRKVRHPIYMGILGMFLGTAFVSGEIHGLVAFAIMVLAYLVKIKREEDVLSEQFGQEYKDYRRGTWF
jgi:protein-S-isoprenylcysteine O-methyltransferase Ste14